MNAETNCGVSLMQGDCLERMKEIPDGSVDMILADLPYGTTACEWDTRIPFEPLWEQYERIIKDNGAIVLFSQMPFGAELIQSNRRLFRYEWIWDRINKAGFLNARKMPMRRHENILVFYKKLPTYNPQMTYGKPVKLKASAHISTVYGGVQRLEHANEDGKRYPSDIIAFANNRFLKVQHPTQKPVGLLREILEDFTEENASVLDCFAGSGSTLIACEVSNRTCYAMELSTGYCEKIIERWETLTGEKASLIS